FFEVLHIQDRRDLLAGLQRDQVADVFALAGGTDVWDLVHLEPEDAAGIGEAEQIVVRAGDDEALDEIFVARLHAGASLTAAALLAISRDGRAFEIPGVR